MTNGKVLDIYIGAQKGQGKNAVTTAELIAGHGVNGDHHAGTKPHRQVSLFAAETWREICAAGIEITTESLSTNLLTEGITLDALPVGTRLQIGSALLEISEARKPCGSLTKIDKRLPKATYLRCGQFARVLIGGQIQIGDHIQIITNQES